MDDQFWTRRRVAEDRTARAAMAGAIHALVFAVLGGMLLISGQLSRTPDWAPFAYAAVLAALAVGTALRSRAASVTLLAAALWVEGGTWLTSRSVIALLIVLVLCPFYVGGVRGAFAWRRLERERRSTEILAPAV